MKECKYWIVVLLQLCFLSISCGEKGAKQVAPAQDHAFLKSLIPQHYSLTLFISA